MPLLMTCLLKIHDWKAWQVLQREHVLGPARQAGARRYQVYRNIHDASQALIVAELPDADAARELGCALNSALAHLPASLPDERAWELTGWEGIEPRGEAK